MSDTTPGFDFEDAAPVKRPFSGGRTAAENPFTDVIKAIALKVDENSDAIAKRFTVTHDAADLVKVDQARVDRQLKAAGKANDPRVTVRVSMVENTEERQLKPGEAKQTVYTTTFTFWTRPAITKTVSEELAKPQDEVEK